MTYPKPDASYWNNKLAAYLHDPIDKVFRVQGHEERAADQLEALGLQKTNDPFWKKADGIASGFERGQVPSYNSNPDQNGAVDFAAIPVITHPTAKTLSLRFRYRKAGGNLCEEGEQRIAGIFKNKHRHETGKRGILEQGYV